jgi:DNA-binding MarR family transcriptional regulator
MPTSRDLPSDRQAVGQLLGRLLTQFRAELFAPAAERGYADIREAHLQIFGNIGIDGIRLTQLAGASQLSLAATSELVDDLQDLGYLERRPDPVDKRAKLIFPTPRGRTALNDAGDRVAEIEEHWAQLVGAAEFHTACQTLQRILDHTTGSTPPGRPPGNPSSGETTRKSGSRGSR